MFSLLPLLVLRRTKYRQLTLTGYGGVAVSLFLTRYSVSLPHRAVVIFGA